MKLIWRVVAAVAVAVLAVAPVACSDDGGSDGGGGSSSGGGGSSAAGGDAEPKAEGTLRVLSYNVAGLPQEFSDENPEEHIPLISPKLAGYDLVLTQEDFDWWTPFMEDFDFVNYHQRLRAEAGYEFATERHPGPEAAEVDPSGRPLMQVGDGLGILSRFPIADVERKAWRACFGSVDTSDGGAGDCLAMKGFLASTVTLADGVEVDVYTLHVEAGGTDADQRLQAEDMDQLAEFIEGRSEGRAIILAGDTNLHTNSDHPDASDDLDTQVWADFLERTGLTDACTATGCAEVDHIDKLAYRDGGGVDLEATSHAYPSEDFKSPAGEDLSDHPPLVVELRWTAR